MCRLSEPSRACRAVAAALACGPLAIVAPAASAATNNIFTVAGDGTAGFSGDGGQATAAQLSSPQEMAMLPDGALLIAGGGNDAVRRVAPDGTITTVAGTGTGGFSGDGGPATAAQLSFPAGVAVTADGGFLIADAANNRVRRVAPDGTITTLAGTGGGGFSGDGGPATAAQLNAPFSVAVTADGGFLIADFFNNSVRRVAPDGTITTVAGTGVGGFSGDGGPATAAQIRNPHGVAVLPDGGFLIADLNNDRVRRVAPDGTITTVAGSGVAGSTGDGGPAVAAQLDTPLSVAVAPDGGFLITSGGDHLVRRVSPGGTITTVAGSGAAGFSGDGGPATAAELNTPDGLAVTGDGGFLIADTNNHRIRFVDADLRFPRGEQGPPGPPGETGPPGEPGAPGSAVAGLSETIFRDRLAIALAVDSLRRRRGRPVRLTYASTADGEATLEVRRGGRLVAEPEGTTSAGRNVIAWNGRTENDLAKARRGRQARRARPGRYRLTLRVETADGQTATDTARLTIRRRRGR